MIFPWKQSFFHSKLWTVLLISYVGEKKNQPNKQTKKKNKEQKQKQ